MQRYRVGLFVRTKNSHRLLKWVGQPLDLAVLAEGEVRTKNAAKGVNTNNLRAGDKFYMYDEVGT